MVPVLSILLAAAVLAVPLTRRAGFGSVLGYLLAGIVIGPSGLRLVTDVGQIAEVSELGVVMLLFLIGLELRPQRLWVMRRVVFGLGAAQVCVCGGILGMLAWLAGIPASGAAVLGAGLAMSSTAIVLPLLGERDLLGTRAGRDGFAVLLFQDLAFIPLVALVPLLGHGSLSNGLPWRDVAVGIGAVAAILVGGRFALGPAFRAIGGARTPELFTTLALLTVVGTAEIAAAAGLSMSLGAFMAGVLLSDSEFRHELRADIEPFEGLLLGFFFISVGMSADLSLVLAEPATILCAVLALLAIKSAVLALLAWWSGLRGPDVLRFALALPQGSEFSFVLFAAGVGVGALSPEQSRGATLVIALSMLATPLLFALSETVVLPRIHRPAEPAYDSITGPPAPVIICGFGRVGQIVGRILRMQNIPFTALDKDPAQIEVVRRFGSTVYFGNPERPDVLRAAGAETARLLVVTVEETEENLRVVEIARRNYPGLRILARARNRRHAHLLMDLGIKDIVRDTFHSSLVLTEAVLRGLGKSQAQATRAVALFREHDERQLVETHAVFRDETQFIQTVQQAAEELRSLFEADQREQQEEREPAS